MNSRYAPIAALTALAVIVVLALGWFLAIKPKFNDAAALQAKAEEVETNTAMITTQTAKLAKYQTDLEALAPLDDLITANAPTTLDIQAYRARIFTAAKSADVTLTEIALSGSGVVAGWEIDPAARPSTSIAKLFATGPVVPEGTTSEYQAPVTQAPPQGAVVTDLTQVPVEITITGSYANAMKFLRILGKEDQQLFLVSDVQIDARPQGSSEIPGAPDAEDGDIIVSFTGFFYLLHPDSTVVDDGGPLGPVSPGKSPFVSGDEYKTK